MEIELEIRIQNDLILKQALKKRWPFSLEERKERLVEDLQRELEYVNNQKNLNKDKGVFNFIKDSVFVNVYSNVEDVKTISNEIVTLAKYSSGDKSNEDLFELVSKNMNYLISINAVPIEGKFFSSEVENRSKINFNASYNFNITEEINEELIFKNAIDYFNSELKVLEGEELIKTEKNIYVQTPNSITRIIYDFSKLDKSKITISGYTNLTKNANSKPKEIQNEVNPLIKKVLGYISSDITKQ